MFKSEKTLAVPGEYSVVFECCVLALKDVRIRVKSANPAMGVISGKRGQDRMDVMVRAGAGQCVVTATSEFTGVAINDYGRNARRVSKYFNALLARAAPLTGNQQALAAVTAQAGALPSARYSAVPMRHMFGQTGAGKVSNWTCFVVATLILVCLIVGVIATAASAH